MPTNPQEEFWKGPAAAAYMNRHKDVGDRYFDRKGFFDLFENFSRNMPILEVGCNLGINLFILQKLGFTNLHGLDIYPSAVEVAKKFIPAAQFSVGTLLELPYADEEFGAVFSSGVLIHQDPEGPLLTAMEEMVRCSSDYILGFEDYADTFEAPQCYNRNDLYWRGPYSELWKDPQYGLQLELRGFQKPEGTLVHFKEGKVVKTEEWAYVKEGYRFRKVT